MTSKDFQLIAEALRTYPFTDPQDRVGIAYHFADRLADTSVGFNRPEFISAATSPVEKGDSELVQEWRERGSPVVETVGLSVWCPDRAQDRQ
jgi:hypothetical protein